MGTTLTHNVYLPDEGERNCYSGLAQNWQILDDAVGAIAGKANASHTHGNITNAGAIGSTAGLPIITGNDGVLTTGTFGSTSGTFCEGNDSRLSDARTPVAHTHTKSDVTDLLNSNFIPSANNSYDLGSSSYQWNNLYAKNYYYNGTQWGLDQNNTWTSYQTIKGTYLGNEFSSNARTNLYLLANRDTEGQSGIYVRTFRQNRAQGAMGSGDNIIFGIDALENGTRTPGLNFSFTDWANNVPGKLVMNSSIENFEIRPTLINGVNPGALSLPDTSQGTDIKPYITNVSGATSANLYTPAVNGWILVKGKADANYSIYIYDRTAGDNGMSASVYGNGSQGSGRLVVSLPVIAGHVIGIVCVLGSLSDLYSATFFPNLGNA